MVSTLLLGNLAFTLNVIKYSSRTCYFYGCVVFQRTDVSLFNQALYPSRFASTLDIMNKAEMNILVGMCS